MPHPSGQYLRDLDTLLHLVEQQVPGMRSSIRLVEGGHLRHGALPPLPDELSRLMHGLPVGGAGFGDTPAYRSEPVISAEIATDPLWASHHDLALEHGLAACWATPILGTGGQLLGTLAMCHDEPRRPTPQDERLINTATLLAGAIIERASVSEALEMERARLANLFLVAPAYIAVVRGPDHVFELANPPYLQLVGHRDIIGRRARDVLPELATQGHFDLLDRVYATGEPYVGTGVRVLFHQEQSAELEERFVDFVYQPISEPGGGISGVVAHGVDVTDAHRAVAELHDAKELAEAAHAEAERARRSAEEASRLKTEFLATMSHEFRTPLNAILGYAQLLDMGVLGPATPAQHAHLERLQASARHLLRLVNDVLDVAKVDADRLEVRRDVQTTGAAVAAAVALVHPQATAKGVRVMDLGADSPGVAYVGDEHRVRQILINLLSNAVKFTAAGGEVTVECGSASEPDPGAHIRRVDRGDDGGAQPWARIRVADTGPGIAPELIGRLFEPFVQGDGALTRAHGGTGLGLAISRRLARLMGGDLTVQNLPSAGAAFTLWLAAARDAVAPDEPLPNGMSRLPSQARRMVGGTAMTETRGPGSALNPAAYAVLYAIATRLAADAETVAQRYVAALRADSRFPGVRELPAVQLRDHATPFVGLLASQLMIVGETHGQAPELLGDGGQVQRLMAELHGAQRHRLGWAEADIQRETLLLGTEVLRAIDASVDTAATDGVSGVADAASAGSSTVEISRDAVLVAAQYAADVTRHVLEQSTRTALRAYRFGKAAE